MLRATRVRKNLTYASSIFASEEPTRTLGDKPPRSNYPLVCRGLGTDTRTHYIQSKALLAYRPGLVAGL